MEDNRTQDQKAQDEILAQLNKNTIEAYRELWTLNARRNYHDYKKRGKKINNISNYLPDMNRHPILVCGAGPSLDEHIDFIKEYRDKIVVFAVDMALMALINSGIEPDFLVNVDAEGDLLRKEFASLDQKKRIKTTLLFSVFTNPECLEKWPGKVMYYRLYDPGNPVYTELGNTMFPDLYGIPSKLNVGDFTVCMCTQMCKHVAFTGIDFAFYRNKYRADGCMIFDVDPVFDINKCVLVQDYKGEDIYTTDLMLDYAKQFDMNFDLYSQHAQLFNLSKGIVQRPYQLDEFKNFIDHVLA